MLNTVYNLNCTVRITFMKRVRDLYGPHSILFRNNVAHMHIIFAMQNSKAIYVSTNKNPLLRMQAAKNTCIVLVNASGNF